MTIDNDIAFLERVPVLCRLGAHALRMIAIGTESHSVQAGQVLFTAGEAADCAYIVRQGSFGQQGERASGREIVAAPGTLLGESALLTETLRPATVIAREDSTVLRIPRAMFLKMLENYPDAAARLREIILSRADQWTRETEQVRAALARGTRPR